MVLMISLLSIIVGKYERCAISDASSSRHDKTGTISRAIEDATWNEIYAAENVDYREPTLVLFSGPVESACGFAQSAVGPFYGPVDEKVYIDLRF
jgi:uncharacterized protein